MGKVVARRVDIWSYDDGWNTSLVLLTPEWSSVLDEVYDLHLPKQTGSVLTTHLPFCPSLSNLVNLGLMDHGLGVRIGDGVRRRRGPKRVTFT